MTKVLAHVTMLNILQYINLSNQHVRHLKFTQCYTSIKSQLNYFILKKTKMAK